MAEDLEAQGLLAHSYDSLFSVRKRLRKINDLTLPTRRGLGTSQIGAFMVVFIFSVITYGLFLVPALGLLHIDRDPRILLAWVLIPSFLVAQRIAKPMEFGKTIPGTINSFLRFHLDDPLHRRGLPVPTPTLPPEHRAIHYQRTWEMAAPYAAIEPSETDWSDLVTEHRLAGEAALEPWLDDQAKASAAREQIERENRSTRTAQAVYYRRGQAASVLMPDDDPVADDNEDAA